MIIAEQFLPQKEEVLLLSAIHNNNNKRKWKDFFDYINPCLTKIVLREKFLQDNENNIHQIADIICNNGWENEIWDEENIFSNDFFSICKTPICLPATFMGFLSGEYILYLLHPDSMSFWHKEQIEKDKNEYLNESEFENDVNRERYIKKYQRFFGSNKTSSKSSYIAQFEKELGISISTMKSSLTGNNNRKETKIWKIFDLYAYLYYEFPASSKENDSRIFTILRKPTADLFSEGLPNVLGDAERKLLLFSTVIFQWQSFEERQIISLYKYTMEKNLVQVKLAIYDSNVAMTTLALLANIPAKKSLHTAYQNVYFSYWKEWNQKLNKAKETILSKADNNWNQHLFQNDVEANEENIYIVILWRIFSIQFQMELDIYQKIDSLTLECYYKDGKTEKSILSTAIPIQIENESSFIKKYAKVLEWAFPLKTQEELKDLFRIAIQVLAFCNHKKIGFNYTEKKIPKRVSIKWFLEQGIHIEKIHLNEVISCMQIIEPSKQVFVDVYGKGTKFYLRISDGTKKQNKKFNLYTVMKNIQSHACDPLINQLSELIHLQNIGTLAMGDSIFFYKNLQKFCVLGAKIASYISMSLEEEQKTWDEFVDWICIQTNQFYEALLLRLDQPHKSVFTYLRTLS